MQGNAIRIMITLYQCSSYLTEFCAGKDNRRQMHWQSVWTPYQPDYWCPHLHHPTPIFILLALSATTLPTYPSLGQVLNNASLHTLLRYVKKDQYNKNDTTAWPNHMPKPPNFYCELWPWLSSMAAWGYSCIIIIKGIYIAQVRKGHKCAKIAAKKWHEIDTLSLHATSRKYHMAYRFVPFIMTLDDLEGVDLPNANGFSDINWVFVERRRRFLAKLQSSVFRGFSFYFIISFLTLAIVFVCLFHCYAMHYVMLPVWRNNVYICATFRTVSTVTARRAVPRR